MSVSSTTIRIDYDCDGVTTEFAIPFGFFEEEDIKAYLIDNTGNEQELTLGDDYTLSTIYNNYRDGATLTTFSTYPAGYQLSIRRILKIVQELDFTKYDAFRSDDVENALDRLTMMVQQIDAGAVVVSSASHGDMLYYDGVKWTPLKAGAVGQFLESMGTGDAPRWNVPAGGGDVKQSGTNWQEDNIITVSSQGIIKDSGVSLNDSWGAWHLIEPDKYNSTPAGTGRISMLDTSDFSVGDGVQVHQSNGRILYFECIAVSTNAYIDVAGTEIDPAYEIIRLLRCDSARIVTVDFFLSGVWDDVTLSYALSEKMNTFFKVRANQLALVKFYAIQKIVDSGAEGYVTVTNNGNKVYEGSSGNGLQLGNAETWVETEQNGMLRDHYIFQPDSTLELAVTPGGAGDAEDLTLTCVFVPL